MIEKVKINDAEYSMIYGVRCEYVLQDETLEGFDKELALVHASLKAGAAHEGESFTITRSELEKFIDEDPKLFPKLADAFQKCLKSRVGKNVKSPKEKKEESPAV